MSEINQLKSEIRAFADARDWEVFHTPKNLSMAIAGEAGELVSEFQWLTADESRKENLDAKKFTEIKMEIADVALYLFRLADVLEVNLAEVMRAKMEINEKRF
jgi:NTP pyrophosphatase (non-canonical NTP hydrolase)